jgi:RimJ/RimL family protein N-acetyltransferase
MIGMIGMGLEDFTNEVELAYFMSEKFQRKGFTKEAIDALVKWCFEFSNVDYLILTIDSLNNSSNQLALKCGFELLEKRYPIGHEQSNMISDSYYYYRIYRTPK